MALPVISVLLGLMLPLLRPVLRCPAACASHRPAGRGAFVNATAATERAGSRDQRVRATRTTGEAAAAAS